MGRCAVRFGRVTSEDALAKVTAEAAPKRKGRPNKKAAAGTAATGPKVPRKAAAMAPANKASAPKAASAVKPKTAARKRRPAKKAAAAAQQPESSLGGLVSSAKNLLVAVGQVIPAGIGAVKTSVLGSTNRAATRSKKTET
jgi:hypothetical protein